MMVAMDRNTIKTTFLLTLLAALFVGIGALIGGKEGLIIGLAFGLLFTGGSYWFSDSIAIRAARAVPVSEAQMPDYYAVMRDLTTRAGMPMPKLYVTPDAQPNAFATGRNPKHAAVAVTQGILQICTWDEMRGVLAHELSHVAHKDVQVMTVAGLLGIVAGLLVRFAFYSELFGGGRRGGNNSQAAMLIPLIMLVSIVVYAVSFLLIRMLSRYRELAADRSGALLTGQPSELKSALIKVSQGINRIPTRDLRAAEPLNAFFFAPAAHLPGGKSLSSIFSTHPSLERRLAELDKVQQQLNQAG